jgi:hypothetical protein
MLQHNNHHGDEIVALETLAEPDRPDRAARTPTAFP